MSITIQEAWLREHEKSQCPSCGNGKPGLDDLCSDCFFQTLGEEDGYEDGGLGMLYSTERYYFRRESIKGTYQ